MAKERMTGSAPYSPAFAFLSINPHPPQGGRISFSSISASAARRRSAGAAGNRQRIALYMIIALANTGCSTRMKEYLPDALNLGPIGLALWGVAAASLAAGLTFGAAWAIIRGLSAMPRLYRKLAGPL
jgi:hypothetical protein